MTADSREVLSIEPLGEPPAATVRLPGSKSITNRALLCAAMASGETRLSNALFADDTEAMVGALRQVGAEIRCLPEQAVIEVKGTAGRVEVSPGATVQARMSGTTGRFLAPLLALADVPATLDGHPQLRSRPFGDLADALRRLGACVEFDPGGSGDGLPMRIRGPVSSGAAAVAGDRSSQFLSGLMLAGPLLPGGLTLLPEGAAVSRSYVEMTAAVMRSFGAEVEVGAESVRVAGGGYSPLDCYAIEPDASAASYFWAAAAITSGTVSVDGLGAGSLQGDVGFVSLLAQMGASVEQAGASCAVTGAPLHGISVALADMSDTAPTLAVVASQAATPTEVRGIGFVRGKESDRIAAVVDGLRRCGVEAHEHDDGFTVPGGATASGARIPTYDDHRIAMAFAVLGLAVPGIEIEDPGCVAKTFPGFFDALGSLRGSSRVS
ncbi:MAG: 3-phosphoshikimate 1-carboxyvinyltransferase [Acidimicrobiaceae bacterium]|nr:3-phosphoshikimate 1-carboxyvinyltransferase [Acidimicrobiaceae bacterium]MCY4175306.1 3-phosphoshikimate 1-carboxyvinyltransferase [Acidimicrobiaceae bacterium]MCY4279660.1 3-phosphoshikimate 1-carboxyvinyltransferase [Acidimicrobiaceae bacterium]MCY4293390.1 3-phosphoshikimate 1-carboxyvinyltransferase [Acidimicrobiaceae bacterium]